jgi:hypothetical protein
MRCCDGGNRVSHRCISRSWSVWACIEYRFVIRFLNRSEALALVGLKTQRSYSAPETSCIERELDSTYIMIPSIERKHPGVAQR